MYVFWLQLICINSDVGVDMVMNYFIATHKQHFTCHMLLYLNAGFVCSCCSEISPKLSLTFYVK